MQWNADLPSDLIERIWLDPQALLAVGPKLQHKLRSTVARIDHASGIFTWKHHNWGNLRRTIRKSLSDSPAKKSLLDSHFLHAAGVPTPRTRVCLEQCVGPFRAYSSYALTDYIAGTSLYRLLRFERPGTEILYSLAEQVAAIWQQLDDLCVWHNDFKTENLLVDPDGKVWLIDLERMRRFRDRDRMRERQVKDARDLLHPRNWRSDPATADLFRQAIAATPAGRAVLESSNGARHPLRRPTPTANQPNQLVTVLIPCRNAADTIVACLESVRDMADEILVADDGSTDGSLDQVRRFGGCTVVSREDMQREGADDVAFESWASGQARHEWILRLRPDEQLNAELSRQVQDLLASEPTEDGFHIARTVYFRGQRLRHARFQNEPSIRLYRKGVAQYERRDGRIEVFIPSQNVGRLRSRLMYEACVSIERCLAKMTRQAARAATIDYCLGRRSRRWSVLWRAPIRFLNSYVLEFGWLDGWAGLHASFLSALAVYLHEASLREIEEPAAAQPRLVHDHWRELKVFDPSGTAADDRRDEKQIRSAA
jgi:hypothetical protein